MIRLPPRRYIKDRGVSDYTYSAHADGYDECLEDIMTLLDIAGIDYQEPADCTKGDLRVAGVLDSDD